MTYWLLNLPFLAVVAVVTLAAVLTRRGPRWRAVGLAAVVVLALTAIFDNILVATGIVGYDPALVSGARVGVAPLEDFAYALAAVVLLPALWSLLGAAAASPAGRTPASRAAASETQERTFGATTAAVNHPTGRRSFLRFRHGAGARGGA